MIQETAFDWMMWLQQQRHRIVNFLSGVLVVTGLLGVVYSVDRTLRYSEALVDLIAYLIAYLLVITVFVGRRIPDTIRATGMVVIIYVFAAYSLWSGWLSSGGRVFFMLLIAVATLLINTRAGLIAAILSVLTYAGFGLAYYQGWLSTPDGATASAIIIEGIGLIMNVTMLVASLWFLGSALTTATELSHQAVDARQRAEKADRAKSQFLASMSHELRTPLNAIINLTEFIHEGMLGPVNGEQVDATDKVVGSARHLLALINDVLDISKIESGSLQLFVEDEVDLAEDLRSIHKTAHTLLGDKPVEARLELGDPLPKIRGDRLRLRQIVLNLVSNACKFTDAGTVTIRARREGEEVVIAVEDTGPGIAPEEHETIFETFQQTEAGLRKGGGTGLGLPISRRLAEAHGGRLWVTSESGKGATFHIALPIRSEQLVPTQA